MVEESVAGGREVGAERGEGFFEGGVFVLGDFEAAGGFLGFEG